MKDFTFKIYRWLLMEILRSNRPAENVEDYLGAHHNHRRVLVLRHDVDRRAWKAVKMAEIERALGIRATYYFRCDRQGRFPVRAIRRIAALNHGIGYHYETVTQCRGDKAKALQVFDRNLHQLRKIAACRTACRHNSPLFRYDNLDLLRKGCWQDFKLIGDAVLSFENANIFYLTDTGGKWGSGGSLNFCDTQAGAIRHDVPSSTLALAAIIKNENIPIYLNIHPERWAFGLLDWLFSRSMDRIANIAKVLIRMFRKPNASRIEFPPADRNNNI